MNLKDLFDYIDAAKAALPAKSKVTPLLNRLLDDARREMDAAQERTDDLVYEKNRLQATIREQHANLITLRSGLDQAEADIAKLKKENHLLRHPPTKVGIMVDPKWSPLAGVSGLIFRIKALRTVYIGPEEYLGLADAKREVERLQADPTNASYCFMADSSRLSVLAECGFIVTKLYTPRVGG